MQVFCYSKKETLPLTEFEADQANKYLIFIRFSRVAFGSKYTRVVFVHVNTLDSWHYLNVLKHQSSVVQQLPLSSTSMGHLEIYPMVGQC